MIDLKKLYGKKFAVLDDGTDDGDCAERVGCQEIPCRHGAIYRYDDQFLAARVECVKLMKRMKCLGYEVRQPGDYERVFLFPLTDFERVAAMMQALKKRQVSPERRVELAKQLAAVRPKSKPISACQEGTSQAKEAR